MPTPPLDEPNAEPQDVLLSDGSPVTAIPLGLRVAAGYSWRIVIVGVVVLALATGFATLAPVLLPLVIAVLIAAPLSRTVNRLERWGLRRSAGSAIVILALLTITITLATLAGSSLVAGFGELRDAAINGFHEFVDWLVNGPLGVSRERLDGIVESVTSTIQDNAWGVASGALSFTGTIGAVFAGVVIALLALFFFLRDGRAMWLWGINHLPGERHESIDRAGLNSWRTLRRYTQTSAFVALVDAVGIGLAAWILGVPLALPIAVMVFLFSFIPIFGATISGLVAVLVALFDGGWVKALLMLAAVLVVQQVEGNVLYPWLFGRAASLHPMVILLSVAAGTLLAGLVGAVIAVPLVAFTTAFVTALRNQSFEVADPPTITAQIPVIREKSRRLLRRARHRAED